MRCEWPASADGGHCKSCAVIRERTVKITVAFCERRGYTLRLMARKTTKSAKQSTTKLSKAAFVRSLPPKMPASQVIAKAKANGLTLSPAYIYVIRSKSSAKANGKARARGGALGGGRGQEREFVDLALRLGFSRAQELLDGVQASIQRVLR